MKTITTKQLKHDFAAWQSFGFGYRSFVQAAADVCKLPVKEIKNRLK